MRTLATRTSAELRLWDEGWLRLTPMARSRPPDPSRLGTSRSVGSTTPRSPYPTKFAH
jgi:hypothetical protein